MSYYFVSGVCKFCTIRFHFKFIKFLCAKQILMLFFGYYFSNEWKANSFSRLNAYVCNWLQFSFGDILISICSHSGSVRVFSVRHVWLSPICYVTTKIVVSRCKIWYINTTKISLNYFIFSLTVVLLGRQAKLNLLSIRISTSLIPSTGLNPSIRKQFSQTFWEFNFLLPFFFQKKTQKKGKYFCLMSMEGNQGFNNISFLLIK